MVVVRKIPRVRPTAASGPEAAPATALREQGPLLQATRLVLQLQIRGDGRKSLVQRPKRKFGQPR
jgi:hypothetical protein